MESALAMGVSLRTILASSFFYNCINDVHTQGRVIGTVTDQYGQPLSMATVLVKRTGVSSLTDSAGRFSENALRGDILEFTFVGFESISAVTDGRTDM